MPRAMRVAAWWGCASTIRAFVVSRAALLHDDRSPTKPLRSFAIGHIQNARRVPGNSGLCSVRSGLLGCPSRTSRMPFNKFNAANSCGCAQAANLAIEGGTEPAGRWPL